MANIGIIIPTYNEKERIEVLIQRLKTCPTADIHVVDSGNSTDQIHTILAKHEVHCHQSEFTNRAKQLNLGARKSGADILYFVHADSIPPLNFYEHIEKAIEEGNQYGYFSYAFDSNSWLLKINAWTTTFKNMWTGGGDQTFFIRRELFESMGGFDESCELCEDFDLYRKLLEKNLPFKIINKPVTISARKYENRSYLKVTWANFIAFRMFNKGMRGKELREKYTQLLG